jgi:phosphoribosylanthranilate isomerase
VSTKVKICGVTNLDDAKLVAEAGAWALGMIFVPESPRSVTVEDAAQIGAQLNRQLEITGVFVNSSLEEVVTVADICHLTMLQFHGDEGPAFCQEAGHRTGAKTIKVVPAKDPVTVRSLRAFRTNFHMLDAHVPDGPRGGTGKTFNWELSRHRSFKVPLILSGGLTPDNVTSAIEAVEPFAVDTASGTESSPGKKDPAKVTAFMRAVQQLDASAEADGDEERPEPRAPKRPEVEVIMPGKAPREPEADARFPLPERKRARR